MVKKSLTSVLLSVLMLSCYVIEDFSETDDAGVSDNSNSTPPDAQYAIQEQSSTESQAKPDQYFVQAEEGVCGNGILEANEQCDGDLISSETTCESLGYSAGGELKCDRSTCTFDIGDCRTTTKCGNGILEANEQCDGDLISSETTCESLGYSAGGELKCDRSTCTFDIGDCRTATECGNGILDANEQCEVELFEEMKCRALGQGFTEGDVACDPQTCKFDLSNCDVEYECGNGIIEGIEQCDGEELDDTTCIDLNYGFASGTLGCDPDTCTFDISDCKFSASCGNGIIEPGEQCDGSNLSNASCTSLGYARGTLACSSDCRYDISVCSNDMTNVVCSRGGCFPVPPPPNTQ